MPLIQIAINICHVQIIHKSICCFLKLYWICGYPKESIIEYLTYWVNSAYESICTYWTGCYCTCAVDKSENKLVQKIYFLWEIDIFWLKYLYFSFIKSSFNSFSFHSGMHSHIVYVVWVDPLRSQISISINIGLNLLNNGDQHNSYF